MKKIFCFIFLLTILTPNVVFAQFFIENGKIKQSLSAGESFKDVIRVINNQETPITIHAYWQDFEYTEPYEGGKKFLPSNTSSYAMGDWVSFDAKEFVIDGKGKKELPFTLKVPTEFKSGHYGVLFFESSPTPAPESAGPHVTFKTRVGALFFIEPKDKVKTAEVNGVSFSENKLTFNLKNTSNIILLPKAIYYFLDPEGNSIERGELERYYIPMDATKKQEIPLPKSLNKGKYTAIFTFDVEDGDNITKEIDFEKTDKELKFIEVRN